MEKGNLIHRSDYSLRLRYPEPYPFRPNYDPPPPIVYPVDEPSRYYYGNNFQTQPLPLGEPWPGDWFPFPGDPHPGPYGGLDPRDLPLYYCHSAWRVDNT